MNLTSGKAQAGAQRAENAAVVHELVRRLDAGAAARRRRDAEIQLAASQAAIGECLDRVDLAQDAMAELRADPRVARIMERPGLRGPGAVPRGGNA